MEEPVRVFIERVKAALAVTTDEEAAAKLGISKQAIANWRRRGKIPLDVQIRLVNAFGPELAYSELTREVSTARENEVVYASTLYAYSKFERNLGRQLTLDERISMGYLFKEVEGLIRKEVRKIGFENESSRTVLDLMIALIDGDKIGSLFETIEKAIYYKK